MTKTTGFKIRIDAFLAIDKKDFAKQRDAYDILAKLQAPGANLAELISGLTVISVDAKQGTADLAAPAPAPATEPDPNDPANWPLTTEPLPSDAVILEATTDLAGHIFQTIRLADGTETFRRVTAEQDQAEQDARGRAEAAKGGKAK